MMALESLSRVEGLVPLHSPDDARQRGGRNRRDGGPPRRPPEADMVELSGQEADAEETNPRRVHDLRLSPAVQAAMRAYGFHDPTEGPREER